MNYWLMKSEPSVYSIDDLAKEKIDHWDGIRNYQVRNFMRDQMAKGDLALFYHSNCPQPGVVGIMEIWGRTRPDPTAFDQSSPYYDPKSNEDNPRWLMLDVKFKEKLPKLVSLQQMREENKLAQMKILQRGNRLSITPLARAEFNLIVSMGHLK